jgi:hypothetical protein
MPGVLPSALQYVQRQVVRRLGEIVLVGLILLAVGLDYFASDFRCSRWCWKELQLIQNVPVADRTALGKYLALALLTMFLALANLYLKISTRAPDLQRLLSLRFFRNFAFLIYFSVYLFLAFLAFHYFLEKNTDWMLAVAGAALAGITAANADIKFGGFSLQPLATFLAALEAVVEASISTQLNESNIARRASLRDELCASFAADRLEQECILIGHTQADLDAQGATAGGKATGTYKGLLAVLIIVNSEANARRLIAESSGDFFRLRARF